MFLTAPILGVFALLFLLFKLYFTAKRRCFATEPKVDGGVKKLKTSFLTPPFFCIDSFDDFYLTMW